MVLTLLDLGFAQLFAAGVATIIVEQGQKEIMSRARIDETDVLAAAGKHGLERMGQIKYEVWETSGRISVIPRVL
jgi:uncharacterized membrane protein YcaP (DUF421 family)